MNPMNTLAQLNELRAAFGMPALKGWKESKAKLEAAINKLQERSAFEATQQELDQQATRADIHAASNKLIADAVANNPELAAIVKAPAAKKSTKKTPAPAPAAKAGFSAAAIIAEFGINAKVGRALMRKHNVAKNAAAVRKFFASRKK